MIKVVNSATEEVLELCREYLSKTPFGSLWDEEVTPLMIDSLAKDGLVIVAYKLGKPVGIAGAKVMNFWFNPKVKVCKELILYTRDPKMMPLLVLALEQYAEATGSDMLWSGATAPSMDRMYTRRGYENIENGYVKRM